VDDLLALSLILSSTELRLLGVTCVYGDVDLRARYTTKLLGLAGHADVPVTAGARQPLLNKRDIYWGGHEGKGFLDDQDTGITYSSEYAVDYLVRMATQHPGQIHLIAIGPLTNLALALIRHPQLLLKHVTIMGGVIRGPERLDLPFAEHNIVCDPEAAHAVFSSGLPMTVILLDLTTQVRIFREGVERIRGGGTALQQMVAQQIEVYPWFQTHGYTFLHDPLAAAVVIDPTLVQTRRVSIQVELNGQYTAAATLMRDDPNSSIEVAVAVDVARFESFFVERLAQLT
jgi:purine nucleosidase